MQPRKVPTLSQLCVRCLARDPQLRQICKALKEAEFPGLGFLGEETAQEILCEAAKRGNITNDNISIFFDTGILSLPLADSAKVSDTAISLAAKALPLTSVDLSGCSMVTNHSLNHLAKYCGRLQTIRLSRLTAITADAVLGKATFFSFTQTLNVC